MSMILTGFSVLGLSVVQHYTITVDSSEFVLSSDVPSLRGLSVVSEKIVSGLLSGCFKIFTYFLTGWLVLKASTSGPSTYNSLKISSFLTCRVDTEPLHCPSLLLSPRGQVCTGEVQHRPDATL